MGFTVLGSKNRRLTKALDGCCIIGIVASVAEPKRAVPGLGRRRNRTAISLAHGGASVRYFK